ncbi:MAG: ATP-binding protein [Candidatus Bathyarchaeota archaeon]
MALWNLVLSGFPGSGKTLLSKRLVSDNKHFVRLSGDDMRGQLFGEMFPCRNEEIIYHAIASLRDMSLQKGYNVIIDTTAPNNITRSFLLKSKIKSANILLVLFDVDRAVLIDRNNSRRLRNAVETWERSWELPSTNMPVFKFINNHAQQFDLHYHMLNEILEIEVHPYRHHFFNFLPIKTKKRGIAPSTNK